MLLGVTGLFEDNVCVVACVMRLKPVKSMTGVRTVINTEYCKYHYCTVLKKYKYICDYSVLVYFQASP